MLVSPLPPENSQLADGGSVLLQPRSQLLPPVKRAADHKVKTTSASELSLEIHLFTAQSQKKLQMPVVGKRKLGKATVISVGLLGMSDMDKNLLSRHV